MTGDSFRDAMNADRETWSGQTREVHAATCEYIDQHTGHSLRIVHSVEALAAEDPDALLLSPGWRCAWPARLTSAADLPAVVVLEGAGTRKALGRLRG